MWMEERIRQDLKSSGNYIGRSQLIRIPARKMLRQTTRRMERGVMTVEASVIVPCIVLLTAALLVLLFFVHNQTYYRCAALETALWANARHAPITSENSLAQEAAEERMTARIEDQSMPGTGPSFTVTIAGDKTEVQLSGQRFPIYSDYFLYEIDETAASIRPVKWVRQARVLRNFAENVTS